MYCMYLCTYVHIHLPTYVCRTEAGKKLDAQQFPGPEALNVLGKNHGDTKVINNNNQLEVYQASYCLLLFLSYCFTVIVVY